MLQICAEKCWICIDGICIFVREVMRVLFRNNSKVLLHFRNAFTLPCPPLCKYRFWCFYCRTISKCGELDAFLLPFFKEIRFLWWWEEPCLKPEGREFWLLMAEVKIALGKLVAWRLVHLFFFVAVCCVTNMLECLRKKLNNSFPCHHSIRDRISAVHYYLNRYGIIHYSSSQKEKNTVLVNTRHRSSD